MANLIKIKRSAVSAKIPLTSDLALGELAINTYDGKLYLKKNDGTDAIVEVGSGASLHLDGGTAGSTYVLAQIINGGGA